MRYFLIMNPSSRGGKSKKLFKNIFEILDRHEVLYDYEVTNNPDRVYELSVSANLNGYDVIVAVGGDGTINKVLNGFFDSDGKRVSDSGFGIIYTGTSPDFCKSYGIPVNVEAALKVLLCNNSKEIRIGKITLTTDLTGSFDGKTLDDAEAIVTGNSKYFTTQYFGCCANIGIGAQVARRANSGIRKYLGDYLGTFMAIIRTLSTYKPDEISLYIDGCRNTVKKAFNISIGKTFYIASGIKVKNDLSVDDNRLYCLIIRNINIFNLFGAFKTIYSGKSISGNEVVGLKYGKVFDIAGNNNTPEIEFDGDPVGYLPCRIETAADSLELVCEVKNE